MALGVNYQIKHSGNFIYKLSNEEDKMNFKISRMPIPNGLTQIEEGSSSPIVEFKEVQPREEGQLTRLGRREYQIESEHLMPRNQIVFAPQEDGALTVIPKQELVLVEKDIDAKILGFEVFKHYMVVIQERHSIREFKSNPLLSIA